MDPRTLSYYERHAVAFADRDAKAGPGVSRYFQLAFPAGARIADVGAGSGRDSALLVRAGYDVRAIEPSASMRTVAAERHAELRERFVSGSLPDALPDLPTLGGPFDGALCSAVMQHLPRHALFDAVFALRGLLAAHGRVLVSIPSGGRALDGESRDDTGRLFTPLVPGELRLLFERCGFQAIGEWTDDDDLGRPGIQWHTLLFELESPG